MAGDTVGEVRDRGLSRPDATSEKQRHEQQDQEEEEQNPGVRFGLGGGGPALLELELSDGERFALGTKARREEAEGGCKMRTRLPEPGGVI